MQKYLQKAFRLPWTQNDNPNGWIEPTTFCQLKCPGCYRGVDQEGHKAYHRPLSDVLREVDLLITERNIHTLSIAGGEPLLYPELVDLIEYATQKGLRTMVYTNAVNLDEEKLGQLKKAGLTQVVIHIDKFQGRTKSNTLHELIQLRGNFCELFRKVGGVNLGFIQPLTRNCLDDLPELTRFFSQNRDIISLVVFTLYREIHWEHSSRPGIDTSITMNDVIPKLTDCGVFSGSAYLPARIKHQFPAWLFSYSIGWSNSILGFLRSEAYELIQQKYYQRKGKYLFISRSNRVKRKGLFALIFKPGISPILVKSLAHLKRKLYFQTYLVIRGPVKSEAGWDLCDGCPDAMFFEGKLEPSCLLEEIKAAGSNLR